MHPFIHIGKILLPFYGLLITAGIVLVNIIALLMMKKRNQHNEDFIILEAYGGLGGLIGSKSLYLLLSFRQINWSLITEPNFLQGLIQGGYVFYGGIIGGIGTAFLAGQIHHINALSYIQDFIFLVPLAHAFGRIGCFMAGCCYGIPYTGVGAVVFPKESFGLSGISLFPVQLVESAGLALIFTGMAIAKFKAKLNRPIGTYIISYGIFRFMLEFLRYDSIRGHFGLLSTSQWISLITIFVVLIAESKYNPEKHISIAPSLNQLNKQSA